MRATVLLFFALGACSGAANAPESGEAVISQEAKMLEKKADEQTNVVINRIQSESEEALAEQNDSARANATAAPLNQN
ncbi:MAG: hypothetical protein RIS52_2197 [Pseudomonadota bacterium]